MSELVFTVRQPAGYGLDMSFLPGTGMDDIPASMVLAKAKELLSDDALLKLGELQSEIEQVEKMLAGMPDTTFEEQLRRVEPETQLVVLSAQKELYLKKSKEETAKELALIAYEQYYKWLYSKLVGLKATLPQVKHSSIGSYFKKKSGDPRYLSYSFSNLVTADERKETEVSVQNSIREIYEDKVSADLRKYVGHSSEYYLFALPRAEYSLEWGVPCLDFGFELHLVVELELIEVKEFKDQFYGYEITAEFSGETLGRIYRIFEPDPPYSYWQTIPLSFVKSLLHGELLPDGAEVLSSGSGFTEYEVEDFQVTIPDNFANYLVVVDKKGGLAKLGIIDKKTASILEHLPLEVYLTAKSIEVEKAVAKLIELGQTEAEAKKSIGTMALPPNITAEDIVEEVLKKLHSNVGETIV